MPTIFNVAIDSVVCHWLSLTGEEKAVMQDGLGHAVGQSLGVLYKYDGLLGSRDLEWIQGSLYVLIGWFLRIGLAENDAR